MLPVLIVWYVVGYSVGGSGSYDYPNGLCGMTERSGVMTHNQKCNLPGWQGGCCTLISMTTDMSPTGKLSTCRPFAILAQGRVVLDFENPPSPPFVPVSPTHGTRWSLHRRVAESLLGGVRVLRAPLALARSRAPHGGGASGPRARALRGSG